MRLLLKFNSSEKINPYNISKFEIQGFIYSLLKGTRYNYLHDTKGFKFFCFSNIFKIKNDYHLIISSPDHKMIKTLYYKLKTIDTLRLGEKIYSLNELTLINLPKKFNYFKTSTPIILFHNQTRSNHCYSFKKDDINYVWFFERLKDNALKKYNAFYNDDYNFEGPLFSSFNFKREVAMDFKRKNHKFILIGSLWDKLTCDYDKDNIKFYKFIYENGIGEKNGLGYGMLNNVKEW